jgi:nucleoid DNA-binding protein
MLQYLLKNESVSLPGIGTFIIQQTHPDFTINDNILSPPTKSLIFKESAYRDTGFIQFVAEKLKCTIDQSEKLVEESIVLIISELNSGVEVDLAGIGTLTQSDDKKSFKPISKNFHPEYLYLPSIPLVSLGKNKKEESVKKVVEEPKTVKVGKVSAIDKVAEPVNIDADGDPAAKMIKMEDPNQNRNSYYYEDDKTFFQEIRGPLFWLLMLGLAVFIITRYGCPLLGDGKAKDIVEGTATKAGEVVDKATDVVSDTSDKLLTTEGDAYIGKYSDVLTQEIIDEGCVIVVGSFKKSKNALRMRNKIISRGFQPFDEYHNGFNRIGIIFDCLDKDLVDFIQEVRRDIDPKARYRIPGFEVAYE